MAPEALVTDLASVHAKEVEATAGRGQRRRAGGGEFGSECANGEPATPSGGASVPVLCATTNPVVGCSSLARAYDESGVSS